MEDDTRDQRPNIGSQLLLVASSKGSEQIRRQKKGGRNITVLKMGQYLHIPVDGGLIINSQHTQRYPKMHLHAVLW